MTATTEQVLGPVDFVLIEFPVDTDATAMAEAVTELVDDGVVSIFDLVLVAKAEDGTVTALEVADAPALSAFGELVGARSGLADQDDLEEAAAAMEPGRMAVLIVYENTWARKFVAGALASGGELVASARIPAPDLNEALERLESEE